MPPPVPAPARGESCVARPASRAGTGSARRPAARAPVAGSGPRPAHAAAPRPRVHWPPPGRGTSRWPGSARPVPRRRRRSPSRTPRARRRRSVPARLRCWLPRAPGAGSFRHVRPGRAPVASPRRWRAARRLAPAAGCSCPPAARCAEPRRGPRWRCRPPVGRANGGPPPARCCRAPGRSDRPAGRRPQPRSRSPSAPRCRR